MRRILEVLRLHYELGRSQREIALATNVSRTAIAELLDRSRRAAVTWPLPPDMTESALEDILYPRAQAKGGRPEPDWNWVHAELRRHKGVTLRLLWLDYRREHPDGLGYSQFCAHYQEVQKALKVTMRQVHPGGERMTVDYAGVPVPIIDRSTGEIHPAQVFVASLDASNYVFCEATWTQKSEDFIASHVRAFEYIGGITEVVTPDNLKSGVKDPDFYDPELNPTYADFAAHYGVAVLPARVRRPRDKAAVENAVLQVERFVLAPLRNRQFFSLGEANAAIRPLREELNHRPFQKLEGSRHSLYLQVDKPALRPLPDTPFEFAHHRRVRVNLDYHVEVEHNFYSVPHRLAHRPVDVRITAQTVEVLDRGERVASHVRVHGKGHYSTVTEHMPAAHQRYKERTPSRLVAEGRQIGDKTAAFMGAIAEHRRHPEQGYRAMLGVLRLGRRYEAARMEAAAGVCLESGIYSSRGMRLVLENATDRVAAKEREAAEVKRGPHPNVRGGPYYAEGPKNGGAGEC
jgi:transposase